MIAEAQGRQAHIDAHLAELEPPTVARRSRPPSKRGRR